MKMGWIRSLAVLLAATGAVRAEGPAPSTPAEPSQPLKQTLFTDEGGTGCNAGGGCNTGHCPAPVCGERPAWLFGAERDPDQEKVWFSAEYLLWWVHAQHLPPLIGSLPVSKAGTSPLPASAITTLFGDGNVSFHDTSGGRFTAGGWLDQDKLFGIEGSFFFLSQRSLNFSAQSMDPIVGSIFTDVSNGLPSIITPVNPTQADEVARVSMDERLWGVEANYKGRLCTFAKSPLDLLVGVRYLDLAGEVDTTSTINFHGVGPSTSMDHFATKNRFLGGQVGTAFDMRDGPWSLNLLGKVALGGVREKLQIDGSTRETFFGQPTATFPGGILAQRSNIGTFHSTRFAVLPEFTANLGYQVTQHARAFVGYTFLYMDKVLRPGDGIDTNVNPSFIRGLIVQNPVQTVRPLPTFNQSQFWAQGINFGVELQY